ncbi:MAG: hypothetical protein COT74_03200 [Bdellovibrionales bacterium CG10_big_fil_rev_8_21_14_0_10_45_34]|nr:MAG: hypothetical protein COT74_03200 [Bdellovibrionales bacterium CG10_big_fil_rev_8_21_14_0_10_45_34]
MGNGSGNWPGGDLGIWEESVDGEACASAQLTAQMRGVISYIDMAQFIGAGMSCTANKNSLTLPGVGESLDLASALAGLVTIDSTAVTITTATLARAANDSSGNPVYISTLEGTAGSNSYFIRIKHVPTAADDSTNKGKISVKITTGSATDGVSLDYEKTSATAARMLLRKINFSSTGQDPFASATDFTVDYAKSWNNNADHFLAEINPADYTGKYSYAWQAGTGDSHTRVFNATVATASGATTGTAFFGFGPTVQTGAGAISGMICAWTGPDSNHTPVSKVQRQDIVLTAGKFAVSGTSKTVFDPVADCEAAGAMSMNWNSGASTRAASSTTENLELLTAVSAVFGSQPTAPANVDL